jgi:acyl dehydratase
MGLLRRARRSLQKAPPAPVDPITGVIVPFSVPSAIGRRYARTTGDFNPIHLSRWSAHLFGFRRAIAHGMWTLARSLALIEDRRARAVTACDVTFKRPLYLPTEAELRFGPGALTAFAVTSNAGAHVHLTGTLR